MLFRFLRGQKNPPRLPYRFDDDPVLPDEVRFAAWARALGQSGPASDRRAAHRAMLPDIDLSRAVPAPRGPGRVERLWRWFTGMRTAAASPPATALSGTGKRALGNSAKEPYLARAGRDREPEALYGPTSRNPAA
jgi:hypothetical protein